MGMEKYRVHEVAKDFNLPTKEITEILTSFGHPPKNHMQVLTDEELSFIFERLTQKHPVSSIQVIFADTAKEPEKKQPAQQEKKAAPAPAPALTAPQ